MRRSGRSVGFTHGRRARAALLAGVSLCAPLLASCKQNTSEAATSNAAPSSPSGVYNIPPLTEPAWAGGLQAGWKDEGWSERDSKHQGSAKMRMANLGGFMLQKKGMLPFPATSPVGSRVMVGGGVCLVTLPVVPDGEKPPR